MSAVPQALPLPQQGQRRFASLVALATVLVLGAMYWPTVSTLVEQWSRSDTYAHGFLVVPISGWLIWRNREQLARIEPHPAPAALIALALAGAAWLLAEAGSVNVVAQYAFVAMAIAMVWATLGWRFVAAAGFPLFFLFLAVPVGEFLLQPLMNVTADLTVALLRLSGIPVYREGTFFSVPSGNWSVVEACSGLRYLIASITLGVLYAYLSYRSWSRRLLFVLAAALVPVLANGVRAYLIVMIGHLSDMKLAVGIDHLIYGWVFFGVVMLLLFWVGGFWREDGAPPPRAAPPAMNGTAPAAKPVVVALLALAIAAAWPAYAAWMHSRVPPTVPVLRAPAIADWEASDAFTTWTPNWKGADRQLRQSYQQGGRVVMLELNYFATQRRDAELVSASNGVASVADPNWSRVDKGAVAVDIGGVERRVRQTRIVGRDGQRLLVWQWNVVDNEATISHPRAALLLAFKRLQLKPDDGWSVLIATGYETDTTVAAASLRSFAQALEPVMKRGFFEAVSP
jgi:exosortase A